MRDQSSISAITIWAPWAQLIATGGKDVENRSWALPEGFLGQWVAIHVGKNAKEWKDLRAAVQANNGAAYPDEVWNGLVTHYGVCADQASPPDAGRIIALAYVRGCVNADGSVFGESGDEVLANAANSPWLTAGGYGHVYGPVIPLPRSVIDGIGDVSGLQKYWAVPFPVATKLRSFFDGFSAAIEERRISTALALVSEPCDAVDDPTDRCPTCGYSSADEYGDVVDGQFYCSGHLPKEDYEEPTAEQPTVDIDSDGVVQDDDDKPPLRPSGKRYAEEDARPADGQHGGIIGRYWCGETHIGATRVIGVNLWRVVFAAKKRPTGCRMGRPTPGEEVRRKRKLDDASRHVDCYLVPKDWGSGSSGYDELEAGNLKDGDRGILHLGMAEIITEVATVSSDAKSEGWHWQVTAESTPGWVSVLLARGPLQLAFYLVQREIETARQAPEPAPAPPAAPPPVAQQQLFPDPPAAEEVADVEPAPSTALQLGYTPDPADVVEAELVELDALHSLALVIAHCLEGNGGQMAMPFGWLLKALRQTGDDIDLEQVIDALLAQPTMFDVNGDGRSIQSVRLIGSVPDNVNVSGLFHAPEQGTDDAELLRAHLFRRGGRDKVGNCRVYGNGPLRQWSDERILAAASAEWFAVDGASIALLQPDQAAIDDICRKAFSDKAAEWLPTGALSHAFATALKVSQVEGAAWAQRAITESVCLRQRDKGFGYVWVEVANAAD